LRSGFFVRCILVAAIVASCYPSAGADLPRLLYVGASPRSSQGLFLGHFAVDYARAGGERYCVGASEAADLQEHKLGDYQVVFVDADVSGTLNSAHAAALAEYVNGGGGLLLEWTPEAARTLKSLCPILPGGVGGNPGAKVLARNPGHPSLLGIPYEAWSITQQIPPAIAAPDTRVVLALDSPSVPLVAISARGGGKVVAVTLRHSPPAEYDDDGNLLAPGFDARTTPCLDKLLCALALLLSGQGMDKVVPVGYDAAVGYWATACFPIGYAKYRFDLRREPYTSRYDEADAALAKARMFLEKGDIKTAQAAVKKGLNAALAAAKGVEEVWAAITPKAALSASARREILCCPGTLDIVHTMNCSQSTMGAGSYFLPTSADAIVPHNPAKDISPGQALSFWRGLHPMAFGQPVLPTEDLSRKMWQQGPDGEILGGNSRDEWMNPRVRAIDSELFKDCYDGLLLNKSGGLGWETTGGSPEGGYGEFAARAFRQYLREMGEKPQTFGVQDWTEVALPTQWEPTPLWYHFMRFRTLYAAERQKTEYWAAKMRAPGVIVGAQAEALNDPIKRGLLGNSGRYLDNLQPALFSGWGYNLDPAEVEIAASRLCSMSDLDNDGAPDNFPGFSMKFAWDAPLAMPPAQHRAVAFIALMRGAKGIFQSWASAPGIPDATAIWPSRVYARWDASFEPAVRHNDIFVSGQPVQPTVAIWHSNDSIMMAQPGAALDEAAAEAPAQWAKLAIQAGYTPHFVYDDDILAGRLSRFKVLVVPCVVCVSDGHVAAIEKFAQDGGIVIVAAGSGAFDIYHRKRPFAFGNLCGIEAAESEVADSAGSLSVSDPKRLAGVSEIGGAPVAQAVTAVRGTAEVIAQTRDGKPGATLRPVGKGRAVFISRTLVAGKGDNALFVARLLQDAEIYPYAYAELPQNAKGYPVRLLGYRGKDGTSQYVGVISYAMPDRQKAVRGITVRVAVQKGNYTVKRFSTDRPFTRNDPTGDLVANTVRNGRLTFKTDLAPFGALLFEIRRK